MQIATRIRLNLILYVVLFIGAGCLLLFSFNNLRNLVDKEQQVEQLFISVIDLSHLTERYFTNPEILQLWSLRYDLLKDNLEKFQQQNPEQPKRVSLIRNQYASINELFQFTIRNSDRNNHAGSANQTLAEQRFRSQLQVKFHDILTHLSQYNNQKRKEIIHAERLFVGVIAGFFCIGTITAISMFFWLKRSIILPLGRLVAATKQVGAGHLTPLQLNLSNDEIGRLGSAFSEMTRNLAAITTSRDKLEAEIRERKRSEAARHELEQQLRQARQLEAIGTMAGGFAHRFNNLLASILGFTEIARDQASNSTPDGTMRYYLDEIFEAGETARDLVANIMTFSNQSFSLNQPVRITSFLRDYAQSLQRSGRLTTNHVLRLDLQEDVPYILTNTRYLTIILDNLCNNALEAMAAISKSQEDDNPEQGGTKANGNHNGGELRLSVASVTLHTTLTSTVTPLGAGDYVLLTVRDSGHGIDAATLKRVFDPFYTTKDIGQGDGIGLAMVLGLVGKHGGSIGLTSIPGKGSTFSVYLPIADKDDDEEQII